MPLSEQALLVKEIEAVRAIAAGAQAEISAHERECALRYQAINGDTAAMRVSIGKIEDLISQRTTLVIKAGVALNWKAWALAAALFGSMLSALIWESAQLYGLHPHTAQVSKP